jgi:MFS family permease
MTLSSPGGHGARRLIATACFAHVLSMTGFSTYAALLPRLQAAWSLSNAEAGLVSGLFFAGYMVAVPLLTSLTDRTDPRRIYAASCIAISIGMIGMAVFAQGLVSASLAHVVAGIGFAGTYMPGLRALTDRVTGPAQSRGISFYTAIFGAGISLSVLLAGAVAHRWGWQAAFLAAALGPPLAALVMAVGLGPAPARAPAPRRLLDFRPVLRARRTMAFVYGYAVHCWELFGSRSWMVAFLAFAERASGAVWPVGPIAIAAAANALAPLASIGGNEAALRSSRTRVIRIGMTASGVLTCTIGFLAGASWIVLCAIVVMHMLLVMSDSSTLTAGMVASSAQEWRGSAMAVHSTLGFGAGFVAPLAFGAALDLFGGNLSATGWAVAFLTLGIGGVAAPLLLRLRG